MSSALKNVKVPSCDETKNWVMSQKKQICKDFGSVVEDEDLFKAIDEQGNAYVSRKINSGFD